jgi:hypothetical protein
MLEINCKITRYKFNLELVESDTVTGGTIMCNFKYLMTGRTLQFMTGLLTVKQLNKLKLDGILTVLLDPQLFYKSDTMLEINCQFWIDNYDLSDFSNSIANSGDRDIGRHTWENACEAILDGYKSQDASQQIITSTASRRMCIDYFQEFGAWSKPQLNTMTNIELSALALQYIAGNYREDMCWRSSIILQGKI